MSHPLKFITVLNYSILQFNYYYTHMTTENRNLHYKINNTNANIMLTKNTVYMLIKNIDGIQRVIQNYNFYLSISEIVVFQNVSFWGIVRFIKNSRVLPGMIEWWKCSYSCVLSCKQRENAQKFNIPSKLPKTKDPDITKVVQL